MVLRHLKTAYYNGFVRKWTAIEPAVVNALFKEYFRSPNDVWTHLEIPAGIPSGTEALEAMNGQIKSSCTDYRLLPLPEFLRTLFEWISAKSQLHAHFALEPEYKDKLWEMAQTTADSLQLSDDFVLELMLKMRSPLNADGDVVMPAGRRRVFIFSGDTLFVNVMKKYADDPAGAVESVIRRLVEFRTLLTAPPDVHDFDTLAELNKSAHVILKLDNIAPIKYWCSCREYQHYGKCKHSLGLALRRNDIPENWAQDRRRIKSNRDSTKTTTKRGGAWTNDSNLPRGSGFEVMDTTPYLTGRGALGGRADYA